MEVASAKLKKNKELYGLLFPEISFTIPLQHNTSPIFVIEENCATNAINNK